MWPVGTLLNKPISLSTQQHNNQNNEKKRKRFIAGDYGPRRILHPTARILRRRIAMIVTVELVSRAIRCVALCLCSPILVPLLCLADLCRRRRSRRGKSVEGSDADAEEGEKLRRCEEGCGCREADPIGLVLLQRYLEDQLLLARSVYDCGDDDDGDHGDAIPLLN